MQFEIDEKFCWRGFVWQISAVTWKHGTDWITFFKVGTPEATDTRDIWDLKQEWSKGKLHRFWV